MKLSTDAIHTTGKPTCISTQDIQKTTQNGMQLRELKDYIIGTYNPIEWCKTRPEAIQDVLGCYYNDWVVMEGRWMFMPVVTAASSKAASQQPHGIEKTSGKRIHLLNNINNDIEIAIKKLLNMPWFQQMKSNDKYTSNILWKTW